MSTIGSQCDVFMQLEGLVDFDKEISRLEELIQKKTVQKEKVIRITEVEGYENKVLIVYCYCCCLLLSLLLFTVVIVVVYSCHCCCLLFTLVIVYCCHCSGTY